MIYFFNDKNPYFTNTLLASKKKARHTRFSIIWTLTHSNYSLTTQTPNSNLELISPYNIIPSLTIKVMRIGEMIINKKKALECWANSSCQKTKKSMKNMHI